MPLSMLDVWFRYPKGPDILRGLDLLVEPSTPASVMAPSGTGKTTLLAIAGGLMPPSSGRVATDIAFAGGTDGLHAPSAPRVGWVLQTVNLVGHQTVEHNVGLPLLAQGKTEQEAVAAGLTVLEQFGLQHLAKRLGRTLSGGEAQRVGVARALAMRPDIIIADEPTANLDPSSAHTVALALLGTHADCPILVATHDPAVAALATRRYLLRDGVLHEAS